jgi:hypothetical protein
LFVRGRREVYVMCSLFPVNTLIKSQYFSKYESNENRKNENNVIFLSIRNNLAEQQLEEQFQVAK